MKESNDKIERRRFLKMLAATGLAAPLLGSMAKGTQTPDSNWPFSAPKPGVPSTSPQTGTPVGKGMVPRRKLGKTGVELPCMALGCTMKKPAEMERCLQFGINHFDTAASYAGAEAAIGDYLKQNKIPRDKVFISTKPKDINTPLPIISDIEASLDNSLKTLGVDYIDLFCGIHANPGPDRLTDELGAFGEEQKKKGKIKYFGFSNHAGMADNLAKAAKLPWVDAILLQYSYRLAGNTKLNAAIDECVKAGIGLISIKTQGFGAKTMSDAEKKLTDAFTGKGFNEAQAKIKFVLEDKRFTSCAIGMKGVDVVDSCAAAALDKITLDATDKVALETHARESCSGYCAGCPNICGAALPAGLPMMSDVMRFLMYSESYGEHDYASELFNKFSDETMAKMRAADYRHAETLCPQRIPIAGMVAEAFHRFV